MLILAKLEIPSFFSKKSWSRLLYDFPVIEVMKRRLLLLAFARVACKAYEEVANNVCGSNVGAL